MQCNVKGWVGVALLCEGGYMGKIRIVFRRVSVGGLYYKID